CMQPLQTPFTC
nr:immunoglobulin light chain junction region [Macaca mulatta]MPO00515.1 immunoglobulin light chain junction region [Macaca mulatta]